MKNYGRCSLRKHRDIKVSEKYVTLDILLKFGSLSNTRITSPDKKYNLGRSGKGLISSLGLNVTARPIKCKKERYSIIYVSIKDLSKVIRDFDKLPYKIYEKGGPNMIVMTVTFT